MVKSEECLEKQIEGLLHYFNTHHDHNAALKIVKLESLIIERDLVKLEQIEGSSSQEMSNGSSEVSGSNIPDNEAKSCYSEKYIISDNANDKIYSLDESCIEEEINPSCSKKKPNTVYQCKGCSYQTIKVSHFKCHRSSHTGESPFSCKECSYCTNYMGDLIKHQLKHSGIKPFSCKECSFCTNHKRSLIQHQLTHSGIKPFSCMECPYKTTSKSNLIRHQLKHSNTKPFNSS